MKLFHGIILSLLVSSSSVLPAYHLPTQQYTFCNRALTATSIALLLPLGYAIKKWYDVQQLDEYEQETPEAKKSERNAMITAAISGGLLALACWAKWNIAPNPLSPPFNMTKLNVTCQENESCIPEYKQCDHAQCGGVQCGRNTCGYWATFNAWAIQQLFGERQPINDRVVRNFANRNRHRVRTQEQLELTDVGHVVRRLNLRNVHYLQPDGNTFVPTGIVHDARIETDWQNIQDSFIHRIAELKRPESELCAHFLCHVDESGTDAKVGNHWVTVSVTKRPNEEPKLFYCNSFYNNAPLESLVRYFKQLFAPANA